MNLNSCFWNFNYHRSTSFWRILQLWEWLTPSLISFAFFSPLAADLIQFSIGFP